MAWDAHFAEVREAQHELYRADPKTWGEMLDAGMSYEARHSTPPLPDTRSEERKALDARYLQ